MGTLCRTCIKNARIRFLMGILSTKTCYICGTWPAYYVSKKTFNYVKSTRGDK